MLNSSVAAGGLIVGKRIAIDATTLETNAAMRSIVRRDTGASYEEFLTGLAKASGIETPTREDLARLDRKRKKRHDLKILHSPLRPFRAAIKMTVDTDCSSTVAVEGRIPLHNSSLMRVSTRSSLAMLGSFRRSKKSPREQSRPGAKSERGWRREFLKKGNRYASISIRIERCQLAITTDAMFTLR
jgi:hypothetical protein